MNLYLKIMKIGRKAKIYCFCFEFLYIPEIYVAKKTKIQRKSKKNYAKEINNLDTVLPKPYTRLIVIGLIKKTSSPVTRKMSLYISLIVDIL